MLDPNTIMLPPETPLLGRSDDRFRGVDIWTVVGLKYLKLVSTQASAEKLLNECFKMVNYAGNGPREGIGESTDRA